MYVASVFVWLQFVGYADEILDVALLGPNDSYLAVATNSADIKVYNMENQGCQLLRAHSDFVLTLAVSPVDPCLLLSAGKVWFHSDIKT